MTLVWPKSTLTLSLRLAGAGIGAAIAGPLGGALGSIAAGIFGESIKEVIESYAKNMGEEVGKRLLDASTDSLLERLKPSTPDLGAACRDALRRSLAKLQADLRLPESEEWKTWFTNWNEVLGSEDALLLNGIGTGEDPDQSDRLFHDVLESLDAQARAQCSGSLSLQLHERSLPKMLGRFLEEHLPATFQEAFEDLITDAKYEKTWKQVDGIFKREVEDTLRRMEQAISELSQKSNSYLRGDPRPLLLWYAKQNEQRERIYRNELNKRESAVPLPMEPHWASFVGQIEWHDYIKNGVDKLDRTRSELTRYYLDIPKIPAIRCSDNYDGIVQCLRIICSGELFLWAQSKFNEIEEHRQRSSRTQNGTNPTNNESLTSLIYRMKGQLNSLAGEADKPAFGKCLLVVGDMGSGKTHFLSSIMSHDNRDQDREYLVLIIRPRDIGDNMLAEYLLNAICVRTGVKWKNLEEFDNYLSSFKNPPKLMIAIDDIHTMPIDGNFLCKLKTFIEENTQLHSLFYIFTLDHQFYLRVTSPDSFWDTYGYVCRDENATRVETTEVGGIGAWIQLDELNWQQQTGVEIIRDVVKSEASYHDKLLFEFDHISKTNLRHLTNPFIAWSLLGICNQLVDISLVDLNFIDFVSEFWEKLLPRLTSDRQIQIRLGNCTRLIVGYLKGVGNVSPTESELQEFIIKKAKNKLVDLALPGNVSEAIQMLERGGVLRGFDIPDSEVETIHKVELIFDVFWNWNLSKRLFSELALAATKNPSKAPIDFLENWFKDDTDSNTASGVLEFILLSLIKGASSLTPLGNDIWRWAALSPKAPTGAVWFAASKTHGAVRDSLALSLLRPRPELRDQNRDLFGLIYFVASLSGNLPDGLTTSEIFALLKKYYLALKKASLSDYFIYTVRSCLPCALTIDEVVDTMEQLSGCEVMGGEVAKEVALLSIEALARFNSDCATLVYPVLQYLKAISNRWINTSNPSSKKRYFYRDWVLHFYCWRLIKAIGIENAHNVLAAAGWYRADQLGVRQPLAHEMIQQLNFAFADWYRTNWSESQVRESYQLLVSRLAASTNRAEREAAFYMIRHTRAIQGRRAFKVDVLFRPALARIAADPELANVTVPNAEFLRINGVLDSAVK